MTQGYRVSYFQSLMLIVWSGLFLSSCALKMLSSSSTSSSSTATVPTLSYQGVSNLYSAINLPITISPNSTLFKNGGSPILSCRIKPGSANANLFPSTLSVNPKTCVVSGTPTASLSTTLFTLIATNSVGNSADASISITISKCDVNQGPFGAGSGISGDPYLICTAPHLQEVGNTTYVSTTSYYQLIIDLDLTGVSNFSPIGTLANPFEGSFDGGSHAISNLTISQSGANYIGLFGYIQGYSVVGITGVQNLTLTNVSISGNQYVGALAGFMTPTNSLYKVTINNCSSSGSVQGQTQYIGGLIGSTTGSTGVYAAIISNSSSSATVTCLSTGTGEVGGLVGYIERTAISSVSASGNVTGPDYVGGLFGAAEDIAPTSISASANVSGNLATGHIGGLIGYTGQLGAGFVNLSRCSSTGNVSGGGYTGGVIGYMDRGTTISKSFATGKVSGNGDVGGLVGFINNGLVPFGMISDSYASGSVTGLTGATAVGGLVGLESDDGTDIPITTSFATGAVSGIGTLGGIAGSCSTGNCIHDANVLWDLTTTLQGISADNAVNQTTPFMRQTSTYTSGAPAFDFTSTWIAPNSGAYPKLQ
jgi:hypothetical protein